MRHALVVDSEAQFLDDVREPVEAEGFKIRTAASLRAARAALSEAWPDVVLLDLDLEDGDGTDLLPDLDEGLRPEVVLIVEEERVDEALAALRHGVCDYLAKPLNPKRLRAILAHSARTRDLVGQVDNLRGELKRLGRFGRFVGGSRPMRVVYDHIARIAPSEATVLIAGESGTGKEIVARTLHELSQRRDGPFCPVNCGAIPGELLDSELFGHEKGAFTGAANRHRGWFERAHGGTLFLDEITEMPLDSQVRLLRVLETGQVVRVGGEAPIEFDARVLAATNRNVEEAVESGKLREDLYYRLKVAQIWIPPLRDRGRDIELLAQFFLDDLNAASTAGVDKILTRAAIERLASHDWPGNVRELKNAVRGAYLLADEEIDADCLPPEISGATGAPRAADGSELRIRVGSTVAEAERRLIMATLEHCENNKTRAAEMLGISVKTLYNRLNEWDAEPSATTG